MCREVSVMTLVMAYKMKKRIWTVLVVIFGYLVLSSTAQPDGPVYIPNSPQSAALQADRNINSILPTVTVRGFLNFRTTVDGTVIVFTPASETPEDPSPAPTVGPQLASKISPRSDDRYTFAKERSSDIRTTELENEAHTGDDRDSVKYKPGLNGLTTPQDSNVGGVGGGGVISKSPLAQPQYPTGLVTVLGGTRVNDGATTVFETKVIGTYIDGKYAQILQSTSQIIFSASKSARPEDFLTPKPSPSRPDQNLLHSSTLSNSIPKEESVSSRYRPTTPGGITNEYLPTPAERQAERRLDDPLNVNSVLQTSFKLPDSTQNKIVHPTQSLEKSQTRSSYTLSRRFRPTSAAIEDENTVPEFQNTRRPGSRNRYVLTRRNTPSVRLNRFKVKLTVRSDDVAATDRLDNPQENAFDPDDEGLEDFNPLNPIDPARVTYEKTTITSEVTLHVGRRKSVRTLTITTSVPRTKYGYATDPLNNDDIHHANNNAIFATTLLEGEVFQPNVVTRTYTTTERMLKTSVVPILDGNSTSYHTVTESFFILKLITGYKTLPPADVTLLTTETEELEVEHTESPDSDIDGLLDGAVTLEPAPHQQIVQTAVPNGLLQASGSGREHAIVPLDSSQGRDVDVPNPLLSLGAALQQNPLAAVYLGLQQLNRRATLYSTITKSSTYVATDTIYSTKVLSIYDGRRTRTRTLSESVTTTERTVTTYTTTVTPYLNTELFPQNQLQQLLATQLSGGMGGMIPALPPPPPQLSTVTSTITKVTTATSLSTKVYTLIYNAISTKFRTVTSTSLYETTITTTTTSEVPIAITAPPGGVFPFLG